MSYIPYTKNPSGIAFFGSASSDSLLRSDSRLSFDSNTGRLLISGVSVSTSGHQHQSSDIIDFASSISGLIPVKGISAGTGIVLSSDSGIFTINVSGNFGLTGEEVDDRVSGLLIGNSGIVLTYDDLNNKLFISTSGLQPSGNYSTVGHTHVSSNISDFNSSVSGLINGIYAPLSGTLNQFASTSSSQLASIISDETGSGNLVFSSGATLLLPSINNITGNYSTTEAGLLNDTTILTNSSNYYQYITGSNFGIIRTVQLPVTTTLSVGQSFEIYNRSVNSVPVNNSAGALIVTIRPGHIVQLVCVSNSSINSSFPTSWNARYIGASSIQGSGSLVFNDSPTLTGIPLVPTASSGTNTNQIASTSFVRTEISNLVNSAPSTLDTLNELASALGNDANFSTTVTNSLAGKANLSGATFAGSISGPSGDFTNLRQNGVIVSVSGHSHAINDVSGLQTALDNKQPSGIYASGIHTHTSSDITNFDTSVSGLLPVKNIIAGYDINITNNSGVYTVASTNLVHVDSQQPQGFVNRTDSRISVSGNIFTIEPTGSSYSYYNKGIKVVKTSGDSLTIPNLTQINYIHFDTINNQISNKTTGFDFSTDIPIAYIAWNSGVGPSGQMTFFAEERHGIAMDTSTHKWIHYTFGMQYVNGLSIGSYVLGGNGSSNSHATISIGNGTLYQEDIEINITDSSSADPFCQELSPIAQIPVYYHQGTTGQWVKNTATDYPVKYGANGPQYNLLTGGNWTTPDVSPGGATRYFAAWILATNQIDDPIISIMGQRIDSNQGSAESNNSWGDINLTNLPLSEVKPLYRLIFAADSNSYTNVPKCRLLSILDIRVAVISTIAGVTQNDHGSLFGLGDDDHSQYLHVDNNRTVNAIHNFVNGLTSNGLINSTSGNFNSLSVSGIINANQLLINAPDNGEAIRIEGTSEAGNDVGFAVYNNSGYQANSFYFNTDSDYIGIGVSAGASYIQSSVATDFSVPSLTVNNVPVSISGHTHTSSNITNFNSSVSGLFPANLVTGSGVTNHIPYWSSNSGLLADSNQLIWDSTNNRLGIGTTTPSGQLHVLGTGIFSSGLRVGSSGTAGFIIGQSTTGAVPAITFDTVGNNHTSASHPIYEWRKNGTRLFLIDGSNAFSAEGGSISAIATTPATSAGAYIGHGMRRFTANFGFDFAWGESITSINEPGIDLFPIGGTHISSGILFRLSRDVNKTNVALQINGNGNVGIGTTSPSGRLHVVGTGIFTDAVSIGSTTLSDNNLINIINSTNLNLWENFR